MEHFLNLFKPYGINHTGMFARLFCLFLAIQLLLNFKYQLAYFKTRPQKVYGQSPKLFGSFKISDLNQKEFIAAGVSLIISLIFITAGIVPHLFALLALACYFLYFNPITSLASVQRKTNLIPFVLLVLLVSPSLDKPLSQAASGWETVLIKIGLAQMYLSAGIQKLRLSGLKWYNGESLQGYLLENYLSNGKSSAYALARKKWLCALLSMLTLFFELTFWLVLLFPQLTWAYLILAISFHTGTLITMRINYLKYLSPVYMVFFTDAAFFIKDKFGL